MTLRKYFSIARAAVIETLQFRLSLLMTVVGNLLYLLLIYNLWKAIFASSTEPVINGMTFEDTMIYLVFASALFNFMEMYMVWGMGRSIQEGQIVVELLKPMKHRTYTFFNGIGESVVKFFTTFMPTAIIVYFVSKRAIPLGWNLLFFVISVICSMLIHFYIDYIVGTICMYTESIWGINIMKEVIVSLLSGATIPLVFFPDVLQKIAMVLPFQAMCNAPLRLLLNTDISGKELVTVLGMQIAWVILLRIGSDIFFRISVKKITVNGG